MLKFVTPFNYSRDKENFLKTMNRTAGKGGWFWVFRVGKQIYSFDLGMQLYEDAYWLLLQKNSKVIKKLVDYYDVFVVNNEDLESGLSYKKQTQKWSDHYADIAIRRCLRRMGVWFKGKELFEVSGTPLDDRRVSFHLPHLVDNPDKSARSWIESNKVIVIAKEVEDQCKLSEILVK